jgi:hypothetical protein
MRIAVAVAVVLFVTDLISHAEAEQPAHMVNVMRLAGFWEIFSTDEGSDSCGKVDIHRSRHACTRRSVPEFP